jgi:hypothetical protein
MKLVKNIVEGVKFIIATMLCTVLVVVWHYECHQLIRDKERLRQIKLRREEQDRIIRIIKGIKK